jgi:hypothetical protein
VAALYRPQTGYYADLIEAAVALWDSLSQTADRLLRGSDRGSRRAVGEPLAEPSFYLSMETSGRPSRLPILCPPSMARVSRRALANLRFFGRSLRREPVQRRQTGPMAARSRGGRALARAAPKGTGGDRAMPACLSWHSTPARRGRVHRQPRHPRARFRDSSARPKIEAPGPLTQPDRAGPPPPVREPAPRTACYAERRQNPSRGRNHAARVRHSIAWIEGATS